jgi:SAM-dependent methyltransferase
MSSLGADRMPDAAEFRRRLETYYVRYYRDTLAISGWRDLVEVRLADEAHEGRRLERLERVLGRPVRGRRLLNVGCGPGGFSAIAHRAGAEVWGVDASAEAVALAAVRTPDAHALLAEAEALPLPDRSFDIVYCYSTLEHVTSARRAVCEMVRVLRPDGVLYLHTPNRWACFEGHYKVFWPPGLPRPLVSAYLRARGRPTAFLRSLRPLSFRQCRALLEGAGARIVRVRDDLGDRPVGGPLWPLVRAYYRLFGIRPHLEFVAGRRGKS